MRKVYWRRLYLPLFILSTTSLIFLVFTTIIRHHQSGDFRSQIFYTEPVPCSDAPVIINDKFTGVPPNYLVIPYREFVMRTSISCRAFKLDNPGKDSSRFHPKYSKYLRGSFPYILPDTNITFEDVEDFYSNILTRKKPLDPSSIDTPYARNITFENIPYQFEDGMWKPEGVISAQRTALLVSLQGREYNAKAFLLNMHAFLRRQQLTYTILLIEQISPVSPKFNKGRLYNTAVQYLEKQNLNISCIILHDVDLLPENDGNFYTCERTHIKHTTSRVRPLNTTRGYIRYYEFLIGGVLLLSMDMYKTLNGFSNLYWGWGGEDDDLALRLIQKRMCVVRPSFELAIYVGLPHPRGARNGARHRLLSWSTLRMNSDGLRQIEPMTRIIEERQTPIVTHLKLDVDALRSLNPTTTTTTKKKPILSNSKRIHSFSKT